jgi:hypothetical protein
MLYGYIVIKELHNKKDKTLDGQPGYGNVAVSYQYAETVSKTEFVS